MIYTALIFVISAAVLALTAPYVLAQKDGPNPKSLTLKMLCALGYIAVGILGIFVSGKFDSFTRIMFGALAASWVGDLFLHLWQAKWLKAVGFLGFLSAHFFFIWAFFTETRALVPDTPFFRPWEIIFVLAFDVFFVLFSRGTHMGVKGAMYAPLLVYSTVITTMLCKAVGYGLAAVSAGAPHKAAICACAAVGAVCFVASDFTISMLIFDEKHKKNIPLKMFNMFTYFIAELLLAGLIALR